MSYSDYETSRAWLRAKAKDARSLSAEEEAYLDRELAIKLRERMEHEASVRWWQLFGLEGHRLDSVEAEAQFITHLDKIFKYPPASEFLTPTDTKRRSHHAYLTLKGGNIELGMPGNFTVKAAKHSLVGAAHASTTFNTWSQTPFNERVRVVRNGKPLPNYRYALTRSDGARLEGITDGDGWAEMQQGLTTEGYEFHLLGPNK